MTVGERSYERITKRDLTKLSGIAAADHADRFARRPRWRVYAHRVIAVALCQGAALHYIDDENGIKDFDVWTFYAKHSGGQFPHRWTTRAGHVDAAGGSLAGPGRRKGKMARLGIAQSAGEDGDAEEVT